MFSSNHVQHPSSIHVFPSSTSLFDLEKDGAHFNHHHHHHHHHHNNQFVNGDCYFHAYNTLAPPPVLTDNFTARQQQQLCKGISGFHNNNYQNSILEAVNYPSKNLKKDGHSKIHTAQGPRDRRVRMSIDVAKKFFYLQDLLGFDKASKTLDWLFTKSKAAIKELVEEMKHCSSPGAIDQCEVVFQETLKRRSEDETKGQKKKSVSKCVDAKKKRKYRSVDDVNQSRAEARARARERTKEKLQNKKIDESKKEYNERGSEEIMEPKIAMSSSMLYGYQHNVVVPNDLSSQIKYTSFLNLH